MLVNAVSRSRLNVRRPPSARGTGGVSGRRVGLSHPFVVLTFVGTVPINIRVAEWNPDAPPSGWEADIRR
jgi:hypothetical protein